MNEILGYLEVAIAEDCNLNCRACSHFSPLANKEDRVTYEEFKRDIERMHELFPIIYTIRLLGGEPLLNRDVFNMAQYVRKYYPKTLIKIVSNGLLIPSLDEDGLKQMKRNRVTFDISLYEPTAKIREKIEKKLNDTNVGYEFTEGITSFRKRFNPVGDCDGNYRYQTCSIGKRCTYLFKGKLSGCPAPNVVHLYNRTYGTDISGIEDMIDIHTTQLSAEEVYKKLTQPLTVCRYCDDIVEIPWEQVNGRITADDWIVTGSGA